MSVAFQADQADGPVARLSASVSAEQLETQRVTNERGDVLGGARIRQVAPHRGLGEQQVVLDQGTDHSDIFWREPHAWRHPFHEHDADLGVVARIALSDVVQQRTHQQEIRSRYGAHELAGVGDRLQ